MTKYIIWISFIFAYFYSTHFAYCSGSNAPTCPCFRCWPYILVFAEDSEPKKTVDIWAKSAQETLTYTPFISTSSYRKYIEHRNGHI